MHRQVWNGTAKLLAEFLEPLRENQSGYPSHVASFARLHSSLAVSSSQLAILHVPSPTCLQMLSLVLQASRLTPLDAFSLSSTSPRCFSPPNPFIVSW